MNYTLATSNLNYCFSPNYTSFSILEFSSKNNIMTTYLKVFGFCVLAIGNDVKSPSHKIFDFLSMVTYPYVCTLLYHRSERNSVVNLNIFFFHPEINLHTWKHKTKINGHAKFFLQHLCYSELLGTTPTKLNKLAFWEKKARKHKSTCSSNLNFFFFL